MFIPVLLLATGIRATASSVSADQSAEPFQSIRQYLLDQYPTKGSLCDNERCCDAGAGESCSISDMPTDQSTFVLPGGETRCIFASSTPYVFQVIPGDKDKVMFYLQGGGACWDKISTEAGLCSTDVSKQSAVGVFDRGNVENRFKDYTIVHGSYCSGDVWGGNVTRPYDKDGEPVVQKGLANAQATLDWIVEQQKAGALAAEFSEFVVMGCSAGSVGVQLWAKQALDAVQWKRAAVVPDSYAGVFPDGVMGPEMYNFGFCSSGFLSAELLEKCENKELTMQEVALEFMVAYPSVPYSYLQSKVDGVQMTFYDALALTTADVPHAPITPSEFYDGVNEIFGDYNAKQGNFLAYLVDGDHHCFTCQTTYYTADAKGPSDKGESNELVMMTEWVNNVPLSPQQEMDTVCEGSLEKAPGAGMSAGRRVDEGKDLDAEVGNKYCSSAVFPKAYVQE